MPSNPLKWHGGKTYLARRIVALMPRAGWLHYVEPFFGGGAVLFALDGDGKSETVNDLNQWLVNFWMHLADPRRFEEFSRAVSMLPLAESVFEKCRALIEAGGCGDPVQNAVAFFVMFRQSRQGLGRDFATLSRRRTRRGMNEQVSSWLSAVEGLPEAHERLSRVAVLCRPAADVIRQQDGPETLFYLDPPYLHSTRSTVGEYAHEMTADDHAELLDLLAGLKGRFLLSGYRSTQYDAAAARSGWRRTDFLIANHASSGKQKERKTECVWMNYPEELTR